jgi:hypothetical protein
MESPKIAQKADMERPRELFLMIAPTGALLGTFVPREQLILYRARRDIFQMPQLGRAHCVRVLK